MPLLLMPVTWMPQLPTVLPIPSLLELLIVVGATWRVSHMLVWELGPGGMLHWMRVHTGISYVQDEAGAWYPIQNAWNPLWCVYCTGMYIVPFVLMAWLLGGVVAQLIVLLLALSAAVCAIERWHG